MVTELRFPSPGWRSDIRALSVSILGVGLAAFGVVIVAVHPWNFTGIISMLGGILGILVGGGLLLLIWFTFIYGMVLSWTRWRQFRRPTAVIDTDGIRYLAARRPTRIPWSDIEEVLLERDLLPGSIVTKASVRMTPEARVLREGPVNVSQTRYLNIGLMSDVGVPEDFAVSFLENTAGPRLRVTETDRRTPSATHGYS